MDARRADRDDVDYESTPLTRPEYISAVVHLYRGELYRANSWRIRLDNTTNWAVLTTAGILTFSFGEETHSHWVLLVGLLLITVFLGFEARRFRFYDVWRARLRKIEENFYGPILRRDLVSPQREWGVLVAEDLLRPRFKITRLAAVRARLARNYSALYMVVVLSWVIKVLLHPAPANSWADVVGHLEAGFLPWWLPLAYLAVFLSLVTAILLFAPRSPDKEVGYWTQGPDAESVLMIDI